MAWLKYHLLALLMMLGVPAWAQKSPCNEAFTKILYSDPDFADSIRAAFQKELQSHKDLLKDNLKDAAREAQATCKDERCFEETLIRRSQIEEHAQRACPVQSRKNAGPMIQQVRNLAIGLSALGFAYTTKVKGALDAGEEIPDFPFDITATVITLSLWRTWVMCKNEYNASTEELPWAKRSWKKFVAYQNVILFGNFVYMGFVIGEDWLRGEDVSSPEKLKAYGTEFVVSFIWDQAFAGLGVVAIDPLMKKLPELGPGIASQIGKIFLNPGTTAKLMSLNDKKFLFVRIGNPLELIGMSIDYGFRWGFSAARSALWMEVRKVIDSFAKPKQDQALEAASAN